MIEDGRIGRDPPPVDILYPRGRGTAERRPLIRPASRHQVLRAARILRGWEMHEPLKERLARRLIFARCSPAVLSTRDGYTDEIHIHSRAERKNGWVLLRTIDKGQWKGRWRRVRMLRVAPFG